MVDTARLSVIGYCFGGAGALELARSGAPLKGIVTFHGSLSTPTPDDARISGEKVLVLHGADDPFVKQADVTAFMDEMRKGGWIGSWFNTEALFIVLPICVQEAIIRKEERTMKRLTGDHGRQ